MLTSLPEPNKSHSQRLERAIKRDPKCTCSAYCPSIPKDPPPERNLLVKCSRVGDPRGARSPAASSRMEEL